MQIKVSLNLNTGLYESLEDGITYQLTYEQLNTMKNFFHLVSSGYVPRISIWYNALNRWDKRKVKVLGIPMAEADFTPDPEAPDSF